MANEKILVVDDDKNICELLRLYLVKEGYNVTMVHDGSAALTEFDKQHPDLVLLDVMMPVMDGWEVCRKIRAKDNTPIIMLTAKGETYDKVLALELGADVVVHSATKYLNGHGDVIAGFVVGSAAFCTEVRMFGLKDMTGAVMDPFTSFLILRGLKTLEIRMQKHCANAKAVAEFLYNHPAVEKVYYPGLIDHPGHDIARRQMRDFGGMLSFEVKGGARPAPSWSTPCT